MINKLTNVILFILYTYSVNATACATSISENILSSPSGFFNNANYIFIGKVKKVTKIDKILVDLPVGKDKTRKIPLQRNKIEFNVTGIIKGKIEKQFAIENVKNFGCSINYIIGKYYFVFAVTPESDKQLPSSIGGMILKEPLPVIRE